METITAFRPGDHVADDSELLELATFLADPSPRRRTLQLTWLDADDRVLGLCLPIDDVPAAPEVATAAGLGPLLRGVLDESAPGGSVVAVLERPGTAAITDGDRAWNRTLRTLAETNGARVRGIFVAAGGSVRPLTLDDAS